MSSLPDIVVLFRSVRVLEDSGHALSIAAALRSHSVTLVTALQFLADRHPQSVSGCTDGMADAYGPAVDIHLLLGDFKLPEAGDNLAGKGLVELNTVYLVSLKAGMLESLRGGHDGTDAHNLLFDAAVPPTDNPCQELNSQLESHLFGHD